MRGRAVTVPAFAKLNLTLDVLDRRPDGYHNMDMVMQTVDLRDEVYITLRQDGEINVMSTDPRLPTGLHNLAGKAAKAFFDFVDITDLGVDIAITKHIPDRAGMAGGSSNAAAVIRGLNRLTGAGLSQGALYTVCAQVGSDVPFCLLGGTARATGRGEILADLPPMPECRIAVVKPAFSVSTPELFAAIDGCAISERPDNRGFAGLLERGDLPGIGWRLRNVFEAALPGEERETVEAVKGQLLKLGALGCAMTGTGSAVFGIFPVGREPDIRALAPFGCVFLTKPVKKGLDLD